MYTKAELFTLEEQLRKTGRRGNLDRALAATFNGVPVALVAPRRVCKWINGEFTVIGEAQAGTMTRIVGFTNEGFNGINVHVVVAEGEYEGEKLYSVPQRSLDMDGAIEFVGLHRD